MVNREIERKTRKRSGWMLFIAGGILSLYYISVLIRAFLNWGLAIPLLGSLAITFWGYIRIARPKRELNSKEKRLMNIGMTVIVLWLVSFVVVEGLIVSTSRQSLDGRVNYVIVLGGGIQGERLPPLMELRMKKACEFLYEHPDARVIVSGAQGRGESISEAEAMKRYLVLHGIAGTRIIKEEQATNTFENLKYSQVILQNENVQDPGVSIVTNDFHIFRTLMLSERLGLNAFGVPCRTRLIDIPHCYTREYFAIIKSWIYDR